MSELKATSSGEIRGRNALLGYWWYEKSEADKVIAELKADYKEACDRLQTANLIKDEQLAATRHNKYKRCLSMARWCKRKRIDAADYRIPRKKWEFYDKWYKRWLKIADQIKEAK
jgi:hypothetical protein